jgi:hypothetical protein
MAEVIRNAPQDFWRAPASVGSGDDSAAFEPLAEACANCGTEYLIDARFCHVCGVQRITAEEADADPGLIARLSSRARAWARPKFDSAVGYWQQMSLPDWLRYLHFHEIQRRVGLPTASLVAFLIGLGCIAGAIAVGLFYRASNLAEFQAIQMWRIEWLLGATASFLAAILLKNPGRPDID